MSLKGSKRVKTSTVARWLAKHKIKLGTVALALSLVMYLFMTGAITILEHNNDMVCTGTPDDLCVAVVKFTANKDIFIYPGEEWGLNTDKPVKNLKLYRTWGFERSAKLNETIKNIEDWANKGNTKGLYEIDLSTTCKSTRCGGKKGVTNNKYAYALRKGKTYTFVYTAEKSEPRETIEWSFGDDTPLVPHTLESDFVDPAWIGHTAANPGINIQNIDEGTHYLSWDESHGLFELDYDVFWPMRYNITTLYNGDDNDVLEIGSGVGVCYQESANVSTVCGGLSSGGYSYGGEWSSGNPASYAHDGDWDSYGQPNANKYAYLFVNYSKPENYSSSSLWQIKTGTTPENLTIHQDCWDYSNTTLQFRVKVYYGALNSSIEFGCYNGTGYHNITISPTPTPQRLYEEAMWWLRDTDTTYVMIPHESTVQEMVVGISPIDELYNFSLLVNNTLVYTNSTFNESTSVPVNVSIVSDFLATCSANTGGVCYLPIEVNASNGGSVNISSVMVRVSDLSNLTCTLTVGSSSTETEVARYGWCYQESANESTECGGLSTGGYSFTDPVDYLSYAYIYFNYTKPASATSNSKIMYKLGELNSEVYSNATIPTSCWNYSTDKLLFRAGSFMEAGGGDQNSTIECYNGTWVIIDMAHTSSSEWGGVAHTPDGGVRFTDGNWSTCTGHDNKYDNNEWYTKNTTTGDLCEGQSVWDEAMWWDMAYLNDTHQYRVLDNNTAYDWQHVCYSKGTNYTNSEFNHSGKVRVGEIYGINWNLVSGAYFHQCDNISGYVNDTLGAPIANVIFTFNITQNGTTKTYNVSTDDNGLFSFYPNWSLGEYSASYFIKVGNHSWTDSGNTSGYVDNETTTITYPTNDSWFSHLDMIVNYTWENPTQNTTTVSCTLYEDGITVANESFEIVYLNDSTMCYQETANVSTICGGLGSGSYAWSGYTNAYLGYDGNWSTAPSVSTGSNYFYINYSKPSPANNNSLWQIRAGDSTNGIVNLTIPGGCWDQEVLQFRVYDSSPSLGTADYRVYCYNGSAWYEMLWGGETTGFYEDAMYWNLSTHKIEKYYRNMSYNTTPGNHNLTINCTDINNSITSTSNTVTIHAINVSVLLDGVNENRTYEYGSQANVTVMSNTSVVGSNILTCADVYILGYGINYKCSNESVFSFIVNLTDYLAIDYFSSGVSQVINYFRKSTSSLFSVDMPNYLDLLEATIDLTGNYSESEIVRFDDWEDNETEKTYVFPSNEYKILNVSFRSAKTVQYAYFSVYSTEAKNLYIDVCNDGTVDASATSTFFSKTPIQIPLSAVNNCTNESLDISVVPIALNFTTGGNVTISDMSFILSSRVYPKDVTLDVNNDDLVDFDLVGNLEGTTGVITTFADGSTHFDATSTTNGTESFLFNISVPRGLDYTQFKLSLSSFSDTDTFIENFSTTDYINMTTTNAEVETFWGQVKNGLSAGEPTESWIYSKEIPSYKTNITSLTNEVSTDSDDTNADVYFWLSTNGGVNWTEMEENDDTTIAVPGDSVYWKARLTTDTESYAYIYSLKLIGLGYAPTNLTIDVGNDGTIDWNHTARYDGELTDIYINSDTIESAIANCTSVLCTFQTNFTYSGTAELRLSSLNIVYSTNDLTIPSDTLNAYLSNRKTQRSNVTTFSDGNPSKLFNISTIGYISIPNNVIVDYANITITGGYE